MSKTVLPFVVEDISAFARSLRRQLDGVETIPTHVEMLNLLVKAGGFRNFQHFRAQHESFKILETPKSPAPELNLKLVKRLTRFFDEDGQLIRWPKKFSERMICLWIMWSRIPAKESFSEKEISDLLDKEHLFGDYALLRRELVDRGMMVRNAEGSQYKRLEVKPPLEALELLRYLHR
ncbi:DUF2087 domain-containing protein [Desulfovibrio gilichinskyi]|uniref:DUF2087 domain-containing protein n=1 Tax=Desulfovibrio gilichinskyi TaxID=1519643 RepID=A0A1X7CZ57_9BACT|nr:DUF2087 domain-containing protein [Desulfovibrio gilichinskyi]SMF05265.1 hypothetical protein SAMN06295933_1421 [Desulfovibrio gilichinskyi]